MKILCKGVAPGGDASFVFAALRRIDLFAGLNDIQLYQLLPTTRSVEFDAGETVFRRGDGADSCFVIQRGRAEARVPGFLGFAKTVGTMGSGEFFGEMALVLNQPRAATVVCVEKTSCFVLDRADLEYLMRRDAGVDAAVRAAVDKRLGRKP